MDKTNLKVAIISLVQFLGQWLSFIGAAYLAWKLENFVWIFTAFIGIILFNVVCNTIINKSQRGGAETIKEEQTNFSSKADYLSVLDKKYDAFLESSRFFQEKLHKICAVEKDIEKMSEEEFKKYIENFPNEENII
jgi:hypothetical protein